MIFTILHINLILIECNRNRFSIILYYVLNDHMHLGSFNSSPPPTMHQELKKKTTLAENGPRPEHVESRMRQFIILVTHSPKTWVQSKKREGWFFDQEEKQTLPPHYHNPPPRSSLLKPGKTHTQHTQWTLFLILGICNLNVKIHLKQRSNKIKKKNKKEEYCNEGTKFQNL